MQKAAPSGPFEKHSNEFAAPAVDIGVVWNHEVAGRTVTYEEPPIVYAQFFNAADIIVERFLAGAGLHLDGDALSEDGLLQFPNSFPTCATASLQR